MNLTPPKNKTRKKIIEGIFEIYNSWKNQLDSLNKPYYLKICFFPEDVSKCQVVCAIDEFIDFYDVTFYKPKINKPFPFALVKLFDPDLISFKDKKLTCNDTKVRIVKSI